MVWRITAGEQIPVDRLGIQNVVLLLHGNGANGSTAITDSSPSPKTVTVVGDAKISTAQSKFGGASIAFDGDADWLDIANSADTSLASVDFTLEFWVYLAGTSGTQTFVCKYSGDGGWRLETSGATLLWYYYANASANGTVTSGGTLQQSTWQHIAAVRESGSISLYINGNRVAGPTSHNPPNVSQGIRIGALGSGTFGYPVNGYIDELRFTRGVARYTGSSFTPPTAPFPDA